MLDFFYPDYANPARPYIYSVHMHKDTAGMFGFRIVSTTTFPYVHSVAKVQGAPLHVGDVILGIDNKTCSTSWGQRIFKYIASRDDITLILQSCYRQAGDGGDGPATGGPVDAPPPYSV